MASSERSFDPNFPILNSIVSAALGSGALTIVFSFLVLVKYLLFNL